jgi:hypothetical protein
MNKAYITSMTGAKLRNIFNNFIRFVNHFKGSLLVPVNIAQASERNTIINPKVLTYPVFG